MKLNNFVFLVLALPLTACDMLNSAKDASETSRRIEKTAKDTYTDLKQGNSMAARRESRAALEKANNFEAKTSEATKYMMSFEFQLAKNSGYQDDGLLDRLYGDAVVEFLKDSEEYIASKDKFPSLLSASNDQQNLYALAATMHRVNTNKDYADDLGGHEHVSILSLMKAALAMKPEIEANTSVDISTLPKWVVETNRKEKTAIYLMQARYNIITTIALGQIAQMDGGGLKTKLKALKDMFWNFQVDLSQFNVVQLSYYTDIVDEAIKTYDFLKSIGQEPIMNSSVRKIFLNMEVTESKDSVYPLKDFMAKLSGRINVLQHKIGDGK